MPGGEERTRELRMGASCWVVSWLPRGSNGRRGPQVLPYLGQQGRRDPRHGYAGVCGSGVRAGYFCWPLRPARADQVE